jgi:hypothetical protein
LLSLSIHSSTVALLYFVSFVEFRQAFLEEFPVCRYEKPTSEELDKLQREKKATVPVPEGVDVMLLESYPGSENVVYIDARWRNGFW